MERKIAGGHGVAFEFDQDVPSAWNENEFELLEGDINTSIIDGIPGSIFQIV